MRPGSGDNGDLVNWRSGPFPPKESTFPARVGMTGFKGTFSVNFELPDYIGLGKSASRGFGAIIKEKV
jgi:hypothetical protein